MTSAITPDPAIHNIPLLDLGIPSVPQFWGQLEEWGQTLLTLIEQWIAMALMNVTVLGVHPFAALQQVGQELMNVITQAQATIDNICNALGLTGSGHSPTDLTTALQDLLSAITSALNSAGNDITSVENALKAIPSGNVLGTLASGGAATIADAVQGAIDGVAQSFTLSTIENQASSQLQAFASAAWSFLGFAPVPAASGSGYVASTPPAGSVAALAQTAQEFVNKAAVSKPLWANLDPTMDSTYQLGLVSSYPTIAVTQGNSVAGYLLVEHGGVKESICLAGYVTGTLSGVYLNVYSMDSSGNLAPVAVSGNIVGQIPGNTSPARFYWDMPSADYLSTTQGAIYLVEIEVFGSGTFNLVAETSIVTFAGANPAQLGATRATGSSYSAPATSSAPGASGSSFSYSDTVPWFGLSGSEPANVYPPQLFTFTTSQSFTPPAWANHIDVVGCGDGGGGGSYGGYNNETGGAGGNPGSWNGATYATANITGPLTINIGQGGYGAGPGGWGGSGSGCSVVVPGYGTLATAGGTGGAAGGSGGLGAGGGGSPGNYEFNNEPYYGGGPSGGLGGGNTPGGGGGGTDSYPRGGYSQTGGNGAPGAVFILAYQ